MSVEDLRSAAKLFINLNTFNNYKSARVKLAFIFARTTCLTCTHSPLFFFSLLILLSIFYFNSKNFLLFIYFFVVSVLIYVFLRMQLAQLVVNSGALAAVIDYLSEARGQARIPAIMTLGYLSAFSETLALAVIVSKGIHPLLDTLTNEQDFQVKGACAWAFGQMGRHSSDHAKTVAANAVLPKLLTLLIHPQCTDEEVKQKTKRALKGILSKTLSMEALDPLLRISTPPSILKCVLSQYSKILPNLVEARKQFVITGCLQRMQEIEEAYRKEDPMFNATPMAESLRLIHQCFPEEIIRYYSPGYSSLLLKKLEEYNKSNSNSDIPINPENNDVAQGAEESNVAFEPPSQEAESKSFTMTTETPQKLQETSKEKESGIEEAKTTVTS
ncbi:Sperm-associated antigen 6 [Coelomomyces lativittatus]|nr:Sperm-associated antigen 6 [Coelomomyces lativittatus]